MKTKTNNYKIIFTKHFFQRKRERNKKFTENQILEMFDFCKINENGIKKIRTKFGQIILEKIQEKIIFKTIY